MKILEILPFPENFFDFHPPKFLMTFYCHQPQISRISPLFSVFKYISPYFEKKYSFPLFLKISPCFRQIYVFFTYFICFSSPPTFTMMHLCITQCTYWTPLASSSLQVSPLKSRDTYRARNSERMEIL